jgi:hypothetical protein
MFVPSAVSLLSALKVETSVFEKDGAVQIPVALFKLLLQIALASSEFSEEDYLRENPDVAKAISSGQIDNAHLHYIEFGYFEKRPDGSPEVDEDWYVEKYPDVAAAIREGRIRSAKHHFYMVGAGEGRSPNLDQVDNATQWKQALRL